MKAKDEFELLKILHLSVRQIFDQERHYVLLALLMQLADITGNQPGIFLGVCYSNIKITLHLDHQKENSLKD